MPGIKETKGKFPTRIAPQMQAYAKKYGKYMSKHLYIYLMPEAWATEDREPESFEGQPSFVGFGAFGDFFFVFGCNFQSRPVQRRFGSRRRWNQKSQKQQN